MLYNIGATNASNTRLFDAMIPWIRRLRLYAMIRAGRLVCPPGWSHLTPDQLAWYVVLRSILGKQFDVGVHPRQVQRKYRLTDCRGRVVGWKQLRRYMYEQVGDAYKFYTTQGKTYGPDVYYLVCEKGFAIARERAPRTTLAKRGYIISAGTVEDVRYLHIHLFREIHEYAPVIIDHKNGIRHDARLSNLRDVTQAQNMENKRPRGHDDFFVGVYRVGAEWGVRHSNQRFSTALDAAKAYDAEIVRRKPHARTNRAMGYYA